VDKNTGVNRTATKITASNFAFVAPYQVGRCRLIGSKHVLKASMTSAVEARLS